MPSAKMLINVTVGMFPGDVNKELSKGWCYTSDDYEHDLNLRGNEDLSTSSRFLVARREALAYAERMMNPSQNNYVKLEWIWP